jgi:hypothetical protein
MNKTIASIALLMSATASSSAFAIRGGDITPPVVKTYCVSMYTTDKDVTFLGDCDESERNEQWKRAVDKNGCAENQAVLKSIDLEMKACPTFVQL